MITNSERNFALFMQNNQSEIEKEIIKIVTEIHSETDINSPINNRKLIECISDFNEFETVYLASFLLNISGKWAERNETYRSFNFGIRMAAIAIAQGILHYGKNKVSKRVGCQQDKRKIKRLMRETYKIVIYSNDIGVRYDEEWVKSVITNLESIVSITKELGIKDYKFIKELQDWEVNLINKNQLIGKLISWSRQAKDPNAILLVPLADFEELKNEDELWFGAIDAFGGESMSLYNKLILVNNDKVFISPSYVLHKFPLMLINSLEDNKILTRHLKLNLDKKDEDYLRIVNQKLSDDFELAVAKRISSYFPEEHCYVKASIKDIVINKEVVYNDHTGGQIDCCVFIPVLNKILILEVKKKSMPTNINMVSAQKKHFVDQSRYVEQLDKKVVGISKVLEQHGVDLLSSIFADFRKDTKIESLEVVGAFITSYVDVSSEIIKYPTISVSEIPEFLKILET